MLRRFIFGLVATQRRTTVTKKFVSLKLNIISRPFYTNQSYRRDCDRAKPCDCSECTELKKNPVCEVCNTYPTTHQSSEPSYDHQSVRGYDVTSFCEQCWLKYMEDNKRRERELNRKVHVPRENLEKMMEDVRGLRSTKRVSIAYATNKFARDMKSVTNFESSTRWYRRRLVQLLSEDLQIVKVHDQYRCNKSRVDAMDFKLWYYFNAKAIEDVLPKK